MSTFRIGDRVRIAESEHVCAYMFGHVGTIEAVYPARAWESTVFGPMLYRVKFDEPCPQATPTWSPLTSCGGLADFYLEPLA